MKNIILIFTIILFGTSALNSQISMFINVKDHNPSPRVKDFENDHSIVTVTIINSSSEQISGKILGWAKHNEKLINSTDLTTKGVRTIHLAPNSSVTLKADEVLNFSSFDFGPFIRTVIRTGVIPAGAYSGCINFWDISTGQELLASDVCYNLNVTDYSPAELQQPENNAILRGQQVKQFSWTPVNPIFKGQLYYQLKIWRLDGATAPSQVVKYDNTLVYQMDDIMTNTFQLNTMEAMLFYGNKYVWQVQAFDSEGEKVGFASVPFAFKFEDNRDEYAEERAQWLRDYNKTMKEANDILNKICNKGTASIENLYNQYNEELLVASASDNLEHLDVFVSSNLLDNPSSQNNNISSEQMINSAEQIAKTGTTLSELLTKRLDEARRDKDIIRVTCLGDKLTQVNANLRTVEQRILALKEAAQMHDEGRLNHEYTVMSVLSQKFQLLDQEANQCVGQDLFEPGAAQVVSNNSGVTEFNTNPSLPAVSPPTSPSPPTLPVPPAPECNYTQAEQDQAARDLKNLKHIDKELLTKFILSLEQFNTEITSNISRLENPELTKKERKQIWKDFYREALKTREAYEEIMKKGTDELYDSESFKNAVKSWQQALTQNYASMREDSSKLKDGFKTAKSKNESALNTLKGIQSKID